MEFNEEVSRKKENIIVKYSIILYNTILYFTIFTHFFKRSFMKKITSEEYEFFYRNVKRSLDELNKTAYSLYEDNNIVLPQNMICQKTLYQILNKKNIPSRSTVSKFVDFFNINFRPETTIHEILNQPLFSENRNRINMDVGSQYEGYYWIYYLSDNYLNEIHGGVLNIFLKNHLLYANLIMGICENEQFDIAESILKHNSISADINKEFLSYRANISGDNSEKLKHIYYCDGPVHVFSRSVNMELINPNSTDYLMYISLNVDPDTANNKYIGGLPIYLSPSCGVLQTRVCQMCMIRIGYNRLHRAFSLQDPRLYNYLKMETTEYNRYESTITKAKEFQHLLNNL